MSRQRAWLRWVDERGELVALAKLEREAGAVAIGYRWLEGDQWHETRQTARLVASEPPLGGVCYHFACPQCGQRAVKLGSLQESDRCVRQKRTK